MPVQTGIIRSLKSRLRKPSRFASDDCRPACAAAAAARLAQARRAPRPARAGGFGRRPRAGAARGRPPAGGDHGESARRAAPAGRDRLVRAAVARASAAGLGDPALRHALAAPRPGLRAPGDALRDQPRRLRHRPDPGHHGTHPPGAGRIPGGAHLLPQAGRTPRRRRPSIAADAGRLPARHPGRLAGRVQRARRPHRPLPDGLGPALPHRALRRRGRDPAQLRRRLAAHRLPGAGGAPAAGARVPARRSRPHALPRPLPRDLRGRPLALADLQGRLQRHRAGRHRVLPAAVLRSHGADIRLPAEGLGAVPAPRRARRDRRVLDRHGFALPPARRRPQPAAAAARGDVPHGGTVLHRRRRIRETDFWIRHGGGCAGRASARSRRRAPRRRSAAQAEGLRRRFSRPRPAAGRIARPARDAAAIPRRVRPDARRLRRLRRLRGDGGEARAVRGAALQWLPAARRETRRRHRERALRRHRPPARPQGRRPPCQPRRLAARPDGAQDRRPGGARKPRHRPLPGAGAPRPRRRRDGIPPPRVRRRRQALRAGGAAAPDLALQRLRAGAGRAAQARHRPLGPRQAQGGAAGARHRRRTARALRPARRAGGTRLLIPRARPRGLRRRLRLRGDARPGRRHRRGGRRHEVRQADGPPRLRRRRLRQDRGGPARRLRRRDGRQAGGGAGADHAAGRAALQHLFRPLRRLAGEARRAVALQEREGTDGRAEGPRRGQGRHRHRHPPPAAEGRQVRPPRPRRHRRGAPLRRAPEGGAEGPARLQSTC